MTTISHSRVEGYSRCRRKDLYGYVQAIEPKRRADALLAGSAFHAVADAYYSEIAEADTTQMQRKRIPLAQKAVKSAIAQAFQGGYADRDNRNSLELMAQWAFIDDERFVTKGWRIWGVEQEMRLDLGEGDEYILIGDLLAEDPEGRAVVIDHKTAYDFLTASEARMMSQLPKYIGTARALGYDIAYGVYNQVRKRKIKEPTADQKRNILKVEPTNARIRRTFTEQVRVSEEIMRVEEAFRETGEDLYFRTPDQMTCGFCDFQELCATELEGHDTRKLIEAFFKPRERRSQGSPATDEGE